MTTEMATAQALFLRWFTLFVGAGIVIAVILVVVIDPYDQYRVIIKEGFNATKPELTRYQNEIKLSRAAERRPAVLIFGNSRAEAGLDPEAPVLLRSGVSAYNLAVPGSGILNSRRQAEYLRENGAKPKTIILGLEFLDFMESAPASTSSPPPTQSIGPAYTTAGLFWHFDTLFSLASVKDALRTISIQGDEEADVTTSTGFNPLRGYGPIARREGYFRLFQQRAQENTRTYLRKANGALSLTDLTHLDAILDLAADSGSDVKLIIYPYHAQILALFEETGLVLAFQEWKVALTNAVYAARQRNPRISVDLFDFSGYGPYNCEKIPENGDHSTYTRWYWEAGHFKKQLGDVVLEVILTGSSPPQSSSPMPTVSFGFRLDDSNSAENLKRISLERAECHEQYPDLFFDAAALVRRERERK